MRYINLHFTLLYLLYLFFSLISLQLYCLVTEMILIFETTLLELGFLSTV